MSVLALAALFGDLAVDELIYSGDDVTLVARSTQPAPACPQGGQPSSHVHSSYRRTPPASWCRDYRA